MLRLHPFGDDISARRETAFGKIPHRIADTRLAASKLGL
jgi:hypothetical protein